MSEIQEYQKRITQKRNWKKAILLLGLIALALISSLALYQTLPILTFSILTVTGLIIGFQILQARTIVHTLFKQKRILLKEIQFTEMAFYKRKLTETQYRQMVEQKNRELIKIDGQIEHAFSSKKENPENIVLNQIALGKKTELNKLLKQKEQLQIEDQVLVKKFETRKIDPKTYENLANENKQKWIELNAKIQALYGEETIEQTVKEVKRKVRAVRKENKELERDTLMEIAQEVTEQLEEKKEN
ncbi:MAG: hypothetical protein Q7S92_05970 [Candidatus Diapherotrites archaeon]|nr:hypothetical protein [Candidatus Diapherotrites archaeon]